MNIHDLQTVLRERAGEAGSGGPDLEALLGKGRALRRRRRIASAAAAAAVVAAAVAVPVLVTGGTNSGGGPATIVPDVSSAPVPAPSSASPTPAPSAPSPSVSVVVPPAATLTPPPSASSAPPITVTPPPVDTSILVYGDCRTPTFEPSTIVVTCADYGLVFQGLQWRSWSATSATAVGTESYKPCVPDCAEGGIKQVPDTTVTLSDPVRDPSGRLIWSQIEFSPEPPGYPSGPEPLPITRI